MQFCCRTPRGVRGLKLWFYYTIHARVCRTPRGVRGLKLDLTVADPLPHTSHPSRGAWIEICEQCNTKARR